MVAIRRAGAHALLLECQDGDEALRTAAQLQSAAAEVGADDVIAGATTVMVIGLELDPGRVRAVVDEAPETTVITPAEEVLVPVTFDGPDLDDPRLPELMCRAPWQVAFLGFAPGFGYLRRPDMDDRSPLWLPRKDQSRSVIPARSVALAAGYAAVYPRQSPGGWNIIGTVAEPINFFDTTAGALLTPGMAVQFVEVAR